MLYTIPLAVLGGALTPALLAHLGLIVAIIGFGIAADRYVNPDAVRARLSATLRTAIEFVAFGVLGALLFVEWIEVPVVDDTVFAFGAFVALWIGLPLVAAQFVEPRNDQDHASHGCSR